MFLRNAQRLVLFIIFEITAVAAIAAPSSGRPLNGLPLPRPGKIGSHFSQVIGWKFGEAPKAPAGFTVQRFAQGLTNPRWIYVGPNGDVFVAESSDGSASANRIRLFRDMGSDGKPRTEKVFKSGLNSPFGMLVLGDWFYIANTDGVVRFPYKLGDTELKGAGNKILDLPAGGYNNHWTRNLLASIGGKKIYVTVGSGSNVAENGISNEVRRANILEINPDGSGERVLASGLRNPVGMALQPDTHELWTVVNERDNLGDDLVPDYLTQVHDGGFYGWPYSYFGQTIDTRVSPQNPDLVSRAIVPDVALGAHTASLGLAFYNGKTFPEKFRGGAFIGQHGSWNRSKLVGYRVAFVPFANGKATAPSEDFLTGFIADADAYKVYGRPVGVAVLNDGSLLVADDSAGMLWRVSARSLHP